MKKNILITTLLCCGLFGNAQNRNAAAANLPYSYGFETADLDEWTVTNVGNGNIWEIAQASSSTPPPSEGSKYMLYEYNDTNPGNTYLFSKGLNLQAGKAMKLEFDYQGTDPIFPEKMEVKIGTSATAVGQTKQLWINEAITNYPYDTASIDFTVPADGVYYVSFRAFSDADQLYLSLDNVKVFETTLATDDVNASSFKFYPNPVENNLILTDKKQISNVEVYDMTGKKVLTSAVTSTKIDLNVSQLQSGTYLVKAKIGGTIKTFKVIKK